MEVKEAIKFLESIVSGYGNSYISGDTEKYETPGFLGVRFVEVRKLTELLKSLQAERDAYKGMWKMLSGIANRETDTSFESELFSIITRIENHYLGGGE